ncbi:unnamed protein product [Adineta steineri]|uniref:Ubiquitin-conjugating enzyme E2 J2 n=1 Tax=Adineta steineri TaxID=433720 RepID=A0A818NJ13_9BILA|nr:unnamed protein product [Adineta steineri]CAF1267455.1 unnamed protein product [Adineta steineri]CAF1431904.1 unnamed protein product [Adineta steineri]CAF1435058.1 unnamed protein product [Adineta steineri]CAF3605978.1 unnamed protein product [Adineta steineri]
MSMKSNSAFQRLQAEYRRLAKDPVPYLTAQPLSSNLLEWRYVVRGPSETPYEGGIYQGKIVFPVEYPYKPPSIYILTPNGRFKTNTSLCLTITSFHPDSWNPSWSISSILNGFLSFMCDTSATFGSIDTTYAQKRKFAYDSLAYNIQDSIFCELFPDITDEIKKILEERTAKLSTLNSINNDQEQSESSSSLNSGSTSTSWLNSLIGNLMILVFLAVFAIIVRFILNSTAEIQ